MNTNKKDIGLRIKNIRLNKGINLREFGEEIAKITGENKISDSIVSRWEKGVSVPSPKRIKAISNYGNVTTNYLMFGNEISYMDIKSNIKTEEMEENIKENIRHFLIHYLFYSVYNSNNEKTSELLGLFLSKENITIEKILDKMYSLISNDNYTFYQDAVFVLLNEKFEKLNIQIYLTEFIYNLLIQLSFEYPDIYFENLLLQFDEIKKKIKEVSMKREIYKDYETHEKLAEFINTEEYMNTLKSIDELKGNLNKNNIINKSFNK
ncbi:helix-turn-helix domain-containing protein [Staphylococcus agnetis]|uniref:helix-turn-helix domain-containing protein n=1 Tax=Staphylococcus agnetis TaxID=985762 RepID=UPI001573BB6B|nr:helix-turn-helix transcriptional regulator [Staphylococcus agnetis]MBY7665720.1 helix-turn-helix domain-containing protein [Staphylococcus agnetis]